MSGVTRWKNPTPDRETFAYQCMLSVDVFAQPQTALLPFARKTSTKEVTPAGMLLQNVYFKQGKRNDLYYVLYRLY